MIDTAEQRAIFEAVKSGKGDVIVDALAGAGKTSTALRSLSIIPQRSILFSAFNKRIAEDLERKLPKMPMGTAVHVKTFHSLGLGIVTRHFKVRVDGKATEEIVNAAAGPGVAFKLRWAAIRLLRAVKEKVITKQPMIDQFLEIGHNFNLLTTRGGGVLTDKEIDQVADVTYEAYIQSYDRLRFSHAEPPLIDFCDMVWLPLVLDLAPPSRYQAVFIDEMQDASHPQLTLIKRLIAPGGRFVGIGDQRQALYGFRGAVPKEVWAEFEARGALRLPLTTCFRCPVKVIELAQELVPTIRAMDGAPEGVVTSCTLAEAATRIKSTHGQLSDGVTDHTFVLSRTNADLFSVALSLWAKGVKFQLNAGREMLEPLFTVLDGLQEHGSKLEFGNSLVIWYQKESARAEAANASAWSDRIADQYAMLSYVSAYTEPKKIRGLINDMINAEHPGVLLSTVHKVKGLEAKRVFLVKQSFARHNEKQRFAREKSGEPIPEEELNVEYVAITRAQHELIWILP